MSSGSRPHRRRRSSKFVRILRKDRLFSIALAGALLVLVAAILTLPKIWRTTPEHFPLNTVRISVVDLVQTWSLSRSAKAAQAAHDYDGAIYAWSAASANNPGDPAVHRGILHTLLESTSLKDDHFRLILPTVHWLNALTRTNSADVLLGSEVLERYGNPGAALELLDRSTVADDDATRRVRARCLATNERYDEFAKLWKAHGSGWSSDTHGLALYHDAWLMATDDRSEGLDAALRLKGALTQPGEPGITAARLLQQVAIRRGSVDDLARAMQRLKDGGAEVLTQDFRYWVLLAASGREAEARAQAHAFRGHLPTPQSAVAYIESLRTLGLKPDAQTFLEAHIGQYGVAVTVWRAYFDLLVDAKDWPELRRVVSSARLIAGRTDPLLAEAAFADFRAALAQDRRNDVRMLIRELTSLDLADPAIATRIAAGMRLAGQPEDALTLLKANEKALGASDVFWNEYFKTGYALHDITLLRRTVERLVQTNPGSPIWKNNRAALLLITGEDPLQALELTLEGLRDQPNSTAHQINHAIALIQNKRPSDAESILRAIDPSRLAPEAASNYHLAFAQVHAAAGRTSEQLASASRVNRAHLLPQQVERLNPLLQASAKP